jgi:diacylglycerol kinase family enzyme
MTATEEQVASPVVQVRERPRAAMIVNPYSSGMTAKREREIVLQLREHVDLEVRRTERGGHAPKLARELMDEHRPDVLIACGGDGTANEVLNGIGIADGSAADLPAFALVPAGGTNVLARSVGFPNHPVRATSTLIDAIVERRTRRINLARVDERVFLFAAGVGLDAEVVKRMEARRSGRRPSDTAHFTAILGIYATSRWALEERMTLQVDQDSDGAVDEQLRAAMLLVGNTTPFTYMGKAGIHFMPDADLEAGMDFIAPQRINASLAMRYSAQAFGVGRRKNRLAKPAALQRRHDVRAFTVTCDEPQPVQVDGEYIGDRTHLAFRTIVDAIDLVVA